MKPTLIRKLIYVEGTDQDARDFYDSYCSKLTTAEDLSLIYASSGHRESLSDFDYICIMAEMKTETASEDIVCTIITNQLDLLEEIHINDHINPHYSFNRKDELWLFVDNQYYNAEEVYPNIRPENNLRKMYLAKLFVKDEE